MASRESTRRFHFLKEIASGGFGSVYLTKVLHPDGFSRLAAIKLLHQRWCENAEIAQRMRDEARLLGWLRHRNIVDVIDLTTIGGRVAVIMEYLEAIDFKGALSHLEDMGERMPPRAALEATAFVASALDAAYNRPPYQGERPLRVIHRDIKPSNIMVDESGMVKVLDFGVARADFDHRESHTQELQFGSVDYMPPERLFFEPETDSSDVYSLGVTLYELLALEKLGKAKGRPEKHAQFLVERLAHLRTRCDLVGPSGEAIVELIREMCAYHHEGRPVAATAMQRCRALSRVCDGEGLTDWAERVIPPLLKAGRDAPREPNPLTDSVLSEDSVAFAAEPTYVEDSSGGGGVVLGKSSAPAEIPTRDERWDRLRRAAIDEMGERGGPDAPVGRDGRSPARPGIEDDEVLVIDDTASDAVDHTSPGVPLPVPLPVLLPGPSFLPASPATAGPIPGVPVPIFPSASRTFPPLLPPASVEDADATALGSPELVPAPPAMFPGFIPLSSSTTLVPDDEEDEPTARQPVSPGVTPPPATRGPSPATRPPSPVEAFPSSDAAEAPPSARSWLLPGLVAVGFVALLLIGGVSVAASLWLSPADADSAPAPEASSAPAPPTPGPDLSAAAATMAGDASSGASPGAPVVATVTGGLNFVSKVADTAKITVTCDGKELSGTTQVGFDMASAEKCGVKVMLSDRTRMYAEVGMATAGTYRCFEGGTKECVP